MIKFLLGFMVAVMYIDLVQDEERAEKMIRQKARQERLDDKKRRETIEMVDKVIQFQNAKKWSEEIGKKERELQYEYVTDEEGNLLRAVGKVV